MTGQALRQHGVDGGTEICLRRRYVIMLLLPELPIAGSILAGRLFGFEHLIVEVEQMLLVGRGKRDRLDQRRGRGVSRRRRSIIQRRIETHRRNGRRNLSLSLNGRAICHGYAHFHSIRMSLFLDDRDRHPSNAVYKPASILIKFNKIYYRKVIVQYRGASACGASRLVRT
ncbi:MAG TPA: hypothetical protein VGV37_05755 [Aliidongia sp.]|uniref:hypothetical protein n=1 Tax=Aliidongia sp. TaxID=1914230 RepID=UPI002DDDB44B|nr:hypothetical protein [Aliidongia sp.]HEV2674028.1 hypothetical protein [Aliidongia sp.]